MPECQTDVSPPFRRCALPLRESSDCFHTSRNGSQAGHRARPVCDATRVRAAERVDWQTAAQSPVDPSRSHVTQVAGHRESQQYRLATGSSDGLTQPSGSPGPSTKPVRRPACRTRKAMHPGNHSGRDRLAMGRVYPGDGCRLGRKCGTPVRRVRDSFLPLFPLARRAWQEQSAGSAAH